MKKFFVKILNSLSKLRFLPFEKATIIYIIITSIIIIANYQHLPEAAAMLIYRWVFVFVITLLVTSSAAFDKKILVFFRYSIIGISLIYWYPETFEINRIFINLDYKIAAIDQQIFGFQPAIAFQQVLSNSMFKELFNFGYFSYYPIIVLVGVYLFFVNKKHAEKYVFYIIFSFFSYYIFFILYPTAGPQYYFPAIGSENVQAGIFPNVYHYFNHNVNLPILHNGSGFFYSLVEFSQQVGERPTAAFPSSHVGITTIIMLFLIHNRNYKLAALISPLYTILVLSTVYIQAHYVIDVFAGILSAMMIMFVCKISYPLFSRRFELNTFVLAKLSTVIHN